MPIPTDINDLDPVAGNNSPSGSDAPSEGDNYLRALSAIIRQEHDNFANATSSTYGAGMIGYGTAVTYAAGSLGERVRYAFDAGIGLQLKAATGGTGTRMFMEDTVGGGLHLVMGLDTGTTPATYICAGGGGTVAFTDSGNNTTASVYVNTGGTNNPAFQAGLNAPTQGGFSAIGDSSLGNGLGMRLQDTRTTGGDWQFFVDVSGGEARYGLYEIDSGVTLYAMTPTLITFNLPVSFSTKGTRQVGKAIVNNNASATYTVTSTVSYVAFTGTNVGTIAFTFPAAATAIDGQEVTIYTQAAVGTSSTWASTGATFLDAPATLAAGSVTRFIYHHATTQWLPR